MPRTHHDLSLTSYALIGLGVLGYEIFGLDATLTVAAALLLTVVAASLIAALVAFIKDGRTCCSRPAQTSGDQGIGAR